MRQSQKNKIQDELFNDFEKKLNIFYRKRQQRYFSELKEKIENGSIDIKDSRYKEIAWKEAEEFMKTRPYELLEFIKNYVDSKLDEIKSELDQKIINKEKAQIQFELLKHILLAGENEKNK